MGVQHGIHCRSTGRFGWGCFRGTRLRCRSSPFVFCLVNHYCHYCRPRLPSYPHVCSVLRCSSRTCRCTTRVRVCVWIAPCPIHLMRFFSGYDEVWIDRTIACLPGEIFACVSSAFGSTSSGSFDASSPSREPTWIRSLPCLSFSHVGCGLGVGGGASFVRGQQWDPGRRGVLLPQPSKRGDRWIRKGMGSGFNPPFFFYPPFSWIGPIQP